MANTVRPVEALCRGVWYLLLFKFICGLVDSSFSELVKEKPDSAVFEWLVAITLFLVHPVYDTVSSRSLLNGWTQTKRAGAVFLLAFAADKRTRLPPVGLVEPLIVLSAVVFLIIDLSTSIADRYRKSTVQSAVVRDRSAPGYCTCKRKNTRGGHVDSEDEDI